MANVHFMLQGKGGVGKSLSAATLAQYHKSVDNESKGIDTDPVNASFHEYRGLDVIRLELIEDGVVNTRNFDSLMETILSEDSDFIIDNGASSFIALSSYLVENRAIELLVASGRRVIVHVPITGGQAMADTLTGLESLLSSFSADAEFVIWENEYFGPIESDGVSFQESALYQKYRHRILGIVRIEKRSHQTFGRDMEDLLKAKMTYAEAMQSSLFPIMSKQRLKTIRDGIFSQLEVLPI